MSKPRVAYAGMTHLGLCSAIAAASKGFATLGFDTDAAIVARLEPGNLSVAEPDLDDLLRANRARMVFSADPARLRDCDLVYVAPDVPTDDGGGSDLAGLDRLLELVLANTRSDAVVVVLSQVPPGYTRARQRAGRLLYYQVETLVFGRAVERATRPERFIVGAPDPTEPLPAALRDFLAAFDCPILPMRLESAELTKISINCCLVASVTVANTLAELCERIGADWAEIAPALRLDRRIGAHSYLAPGLGLAGGNLERDLATVLRISEEYGTDAGLIRAFLGNSTRRRDWALRTLHELVLSREPQARIGVLGLAYKENTHSVKNSPSLALIRHVTPWALQVFDPVVPASAAPHPNAIGAASALDAAKGVDALAIMTPGQSSASWHARISRASCAAALCSIPIACSTPARPMPPVSTIAPSAWREGGKMLALTHQHTQPAKPKRAVVIGAGGMVGGSIVQELGRYDIPTLALTRNEVDLLGSGASDQLKSWLRTDDAVVFVSAVAPAKTVAHLMANLRMAEAALAAFAAVPPAHLVYISSDAVYADDANPVTERSPAAPSTIHGMMHAARELMFRSEYRGPFAALRPTLIYGARDPHSGYGPNRFRRQAAKGEPITIFGEGEEKREHVAVEDVARLAVRILLHRSVGALNAVTGVATSFNDIAHIVARQFEPTAQVVSVPRPGPRPHLLHRFFDIAQCLKAFPDFHFEPLEQGLARVHREVLG